MAPVNRLLTILSLALLNISFGTLPANALAVEHGHIARGINHAHAGVAKKRGDSSKQCKPRPTTPAIKPDAAYKSPTVSSYSSPQSTPSSQVSQPSTSSSGSFSGSTKVGLAWSNMEESSLCNFITPHTKYIYNWKLDAYASADIGNCGKYYDLTFVPTAHNAYDVSQIPVKFGGKHPEFMKFLNEPDIPTQANVGYAEAVQLWYQYITPLTDAGTKCLSPAVTTSPNGLTWLSNFVKACNNCKIYAHDIHYYGITAADFISVVQKFHDTVPGTYWITEIGCHDYSGKGMYCSDFNSFFYGILGWMKTTSWIEAYFWFGMFTQDEFKNLNSVEPVNSLMSCATGSPSCQPSNNGNAYLNP